MYAKYLCDHQNGFWDNLFFGSPEIAKMDIIHFNNQAAICRRDHTNICQKYFFCIDESWKNSLNG
jgi:hypothetical protein